MTGIPFHRHVEGDDGQETRARDHEDRDEEIDDEDGRVVGMTAGHEGHHPGTHDDDADPSSRTEATDDSLDDEGHGSEDGHSDAAESECDADPDDCFAWEERTQGSMTQQQGFDPCLGWHNSLTIQHRDISSLWTVTRYGGRTWSRVGRREQTEAPAAFSLLSTRRQEKKEGPVLSLVSSAVLRPTPQRT